VQLYLNWDSYLQGYPAAPASIPPESLDDAYVEMFDYVAEGQKPWGTAPVVSGFKGQLCYYVCVGWGGTVIDGTTMTGTVEFSCCSIGFGSAKNRVTMVAYFDAQMETGWDLSLFIQASAGAGLNLSSGDMLEGWESTLKIKREPILGHVGVGAGLSASYTWATGNIPRGTWRSELVNELLGP
jgi:hypothetical protein